jgi:hypothetical protein
MYIKTTASIMLAFATLALLPGCQKAQEKAQEAAMEAALEHATGNKVDIDKDGNAVSIKTDQGDINIATAADGGVVALPSDFPNDVYLPAQRTIDSAMDMAGMKMVNMATQAGVAAVSADVEKAMQAQGWKREMVMQAGDGSTLVYSKDKRQAVYQIGAGDEGGSRLAVRTGSEEG